MTGASQRVEDALKELERVFRDTIRQEQLVDQLTGLPNNLALDESLATAIDKGENFWIAMVEIDYFKRVNDAFGYQVADGLLTEVAQQLARGATFFGEGATAFRAHGDEYFMFGPLRSTLPDALASKLDHIRGSIEQVEIRVANERVMKCTVSVGWTVRADGAEAVRALYDHVERAVAVAKRKGRNQVVRYHPTMAAGSMVSVRETCDRCESAYTCDMEREKRVEDDLFCPNCGARQPRPPLPPQAPPPTQI